MNPTIPLNQDRLVVNARFLTRRITGLERYANEMSRQLKQLRPGLKFVAPRNVLDKTLTAELDVELFGRLTGHLWEQIELPMFLRSMGRPVLLSLMNTGPIYYTNQIVVVHDLAFLRNPTWFSRSAAHWFSFLVPRVIKASAIVVTQSAFTKREVVELLSVPEQKIHVVYPGVADAFRSHGDVSRKNSADTLVLAVSTLEPRKNLHRLIEAFKMMNLRDARLVIVGSDNSLVFGKSQLKKAHQNDPTIQFLGYVTDSELAELYQRADVFASVSMYEGFGFPPLEAFANGCAVLVSDIPSHREIFGDSATYVDPSDTADIASQLKALISSEKRVESFRREEILAKFNWRRAAEDLLMVIDRASGM
jgi:glycosyltransferase involved in cell wall biosynthesis